MVLILLMLCLLPFVNVVPVFFANSLPGTSSIEVGCKLATYSSSLRTVDWLPKLDLQ